MDIFDRHSPSYHFYADDMAAQFHGKLSDAPRIASAVAELITDVKEWCASMRLQLNTTKTEVMWFGTPYSLRKLPDKMRTIDVGVEKLTMVQDVRYLGVCLDGELSMRTHIASVTRSAFYHLRRLRPVGHLLGRAITAQLVASFVLSRLDYCNVILAGLPDASIRPLQRVLNTAARVVLGQGPRDSATAALKELHWLPVRARVEYKLCLLTHRALNGTAPRYIRELLHPVADVVSRSHLRSASNGDLVVPSTRLKTGERAFSVAAPQAWNRLPVELKTMVDTARFKRELKTLLFSKYLI